MRIQINGKKMKEAIDIVLMKGKWCSGNTASNSSLGDAVIFEIGDECYLYNANESTYIRRKFVPDTIESWGRFCIDSSILNKYLQNEACTINTTEDSLQIRTANKTVSIPLMDRHPHNDNMLFVQSNLILDIDTMDLEDYQEGIQVSPKTTLNTVVLVSVNELNDSLKNCEKVGSSVYKLDYNDNTLLVSSELDSQSVSIDLEVEGSGQPAIMEFSAPLHKLVTNSLVLLAFNDESPICIISRDTIVLRAPRIGVE